VQLLWGYFKGKLMKYTATNMPVKRIRPLISVCVTTYNHAKYINVCLDSILKQDADFPYELIIGEDESTDGTREICIEYAERYPEKIKLFLNERRNVIYVNGVATGRWNLLNNLKHAKGKFIALLEGDDYWTDPLKLQKQAESLDKNTVSAGCFHETQMILQDGENGKIYGVTAKNLLTVEDTIVISSSFHTSSFMFRRTFLPDPIPEWFKKVVSADMALFMILASKGPLISIPEVMSIYRKHPGGITESSTVKNKLHNHRIELLKYFDRYTNGQYREKINEIINEHKKCQSKKRKKIVNDKIMRIVKIFK